MKLHPREQIVNDVQHKIRGKVLEVLMESDLTRGEELRVLTEVFTSSLSSMAKHMIREERHPNEPDKPGGLA